MLIQQKKNTALSDFRLGYPGVVVGSRIPGIVIGFQGNMRAMAARSTGYSPGEFSKEPLVPVSAGTVSEQQITVYSCGTPPLCEKIGVVNNFQDKMLSLPPVTYTAKPFDVTPLAPIRTNIGELAREALRTVASPLDDTAAAVAAAVSQGAGMVCGVHPTVERACHSVREEVSKIAASYENMAANSSLLPPPQVVQDIATIATAAGGVGLAAKAGLAGREVVARIASGRVARASLPTTTDEAWQLIQDARRRMENAGYIPKGGNPCPKLKPNTTVEGFVGQIREQQLGADKTQAAIEGLSCHIINQHRWAIEGDDVLSQMESAFSRHPRRIDVPAHLPYISDPRSLEAKIPYEWKGPVIKGYRRVNPESMYYIAHKPNGDKYLVVCIGSANAGKGYGLIANLLNNGFKEAQRVGAKSAYVSACFANGKLEDFLTKHFQLKEVENFYPNDLVNFERLYEIKFPENFKGITGTIGKAKK